MTAPTPNVLFVEDDAADSRLLLESLVESGVTFNLTVHSRAPLVPVVVLTGLDDAVLALDVPDVSQEQSQ